jgi:hypothetical protein
MTNNVQKHLCSFADKELREASIRFETEAKDMKFYDAIFVYDETSLDKGFFNLFKEKFQMRGFGFWSWKPQIILQTLSKMKDGDILQYCDIGCHLDNHCRKRLNYYFEIAGKSEIGILAFQINILEKFWTKGDLIDYFGFRDNDAIINTGQFCATVFFIKKTRNTVKMVEEWLSVIYNNFSLIDDTPSISPNYQGFIEHRHDQSIFSLLAKKYKFERLDYTIENSIYFGHYPILALRDKGDGKEWQKILHYSPLTRIFHIKKFKKEWIKNFILALLISLVGEKLIYRLKALYDAKKQGKRLGQKN